MTRKTDGNKNAVFRREYLGQGQVAKMWKTYVTYQKRRHVNNFAVFVRMSLTCTEACTCLDRRWRASLKTFNRFTRTNTFRDASELWINSSCSGRIAPLSRRGSNSIQRIQRNWHLWNTRRCAAWNCTIGTRTLADCKPGMTSRSSCARDC